MMKSLLSQLQGNDEILLMYLSDELLAQDRKEIDHLLQQDAGLRLQLRHLAESMECVDAAIQEDREPNAERAVRSTLSAMRLWQLNAATRIVAVEHARLPFPWWSYPLAAAASIVVAAAVFFANMDPALNVEPTHVARSNNSQDVFASLLPRRSEFDPVRAEFIAEELVASLDDSNAIMDEAVSRIGMSEATRELQALGTAGIPMMAVLDVQ